MSKINKSIKILEVDPENYLKIDPPPYVTISNEFEIFDASMKNQIPLLLEGPTGIGKTLSLANWAQMSDIPLIQVDCSENTKRTDLIGRFLILNDEVVYEPGILPIAIEIANKKKKALLVLEEINALTPGMQKILNQFLDWRRHVFIPEMDTLNTLNSDSILFICGTMNPSTYGGTHQLNDDLKSRFAISKVSFPSRDKLRDIIISNVIISNKEIVEQVLDLFEECHASVKNNDLDFEISPRDLVMFCTYYETFHKNNVANPVKSALDLSILNKFETKEERDLVGARIESIFEI